MVVKLVLRLPLVVKLKLVQSVPQLVLLASNWVVSPVWCTLYPTVLWV